MIQLYNGDCMEFIKKLPDSSIDLLVTDPPYSFSNKGGGFFSPAFKNGRNYIRELNSLNCCDFEPYPFLELIKPKMKMFYAYIFCNKTLVADYITWAKKNGYSYDILVMCKSNPIPAYNNHYMSDLEYIIVIRAPGTYFSHDKDLELYRKWYLTNCKQGMHPAEKPVNLVKKFIQVGSAENATIFNPFLGSGTTGVCAKMLNRNFIGCEIDANYFDISERRINGTSKKRTCTQGELF